MSFIFNVTLLSDRPVTCNSHIVYDFCLYLWVRYLPNCLLILILVYDSCCSSTGELKWPLHLPCHQQFSVQRLCPSKINFSAGCLPKSFSWFILSLWRSPCLVSLVFSSFSSFSFCTSLKDHLFQLVHIFFKTSFYQPCYQPLARGAGLWPSTALFYIPGELDGVGRSNSSCISRTEFSTCGFIHLEEVLPLQSEGMLIHRAAWEQLFDRILMPRLPNLNCAGHNCSCASLPPHTLCTSAALIYF